MWLVFGDIDAAKTLKSGLLQVVLWDLAESGYERIKQDASRSPTYTGGQSLAENGQRKRGLNLFVGSAPFSLSLLLID
jgi:hypothetical protein